MKNQLSKNIFPEIFSDGHLRYSFDKRAIFFTKKTKFLCSKSEKLKKKFFKVKFPQMFPLNTCIAVLAHLDSLIATGQKKLLQNQITNNKHSFSGKRIDFLQNFPLDARMAFVSTLQENFRIKLLFYCLNFQRILKQCAKFQTWFFPQSLPRLRRLQFLTTLTNFSARLK